jgi:energy-coupling factor transporter ATP-binding protein EcfA2
MSMFAAASGRVAVASSALVASSRQPPSRPWAPSRARRSSILASLEDTAESAPRSLPSASGPFAVDLSALTPDERAWLRARDELKVLVLGKTGVGKSSLVNAIAHADSAIGALEVGTTQVYDVRSALLSTEDGATHDFALFDTPGFFDVEGRTPAGVLRELSGKVSEFHAVVYAHVATDKRTRLEDEQSVSFITRALGPAAARRAIVALTFANEVRGNTEEERAMVIKTRGEQARGLFADAAAQVAGGTDSGLKNAPETEAPYVACGQAGDDTQWESELWRAVIRRAKRAADFEKAPVSDVFDATAAELEVDWEGLRLAGVSLEGAPPRPPPPLELVKKYVARREEKAELLRGQAARHAERIRGDRPAGGVRGRGRCVARCYERRVPAHARRRAKRGDEGAHGSRAARRASRRGGVATRRRGGHRRGSRGGGKRARDSAPRRERRVVRHGDGAAQRERDRGDRPGHGGSRGDGAENAGTSGDLS